MDAREDHLQCLDGDPNRHLFPPDHELVVSDAVSETAAVLRMYSRSAGETYGWTEERGLVFSHLFILFIFCSEKMLVHRVSHSS